MLLKPFVKSAVEAAKLTLPADPCPSVVSPLLSLPCPFSLQLFNKEINPYLNDAEFDALLSEFQADYNQTHFVRSPEFKEAADKIQGPARQIFVEFLERSCTAEFSGFLLYKELGRRLKVRLLGCIWQLSELRRET